MTGLSRENQQDQGQAIQMMRLMTHLNLYAEAGLHASWLPKDWPPPYRRVEHLGQAGRALVARKLQLQHGLEGQIDFNFDSRLKRLALVDGRSLRLMAIYCGFSVHQSLLLSRGGVGLHMRRQLRRIDKAKNAMEFLTKRIPVLSTLRMNTRSIEQRPISTGHVVVTRGYRLLLALIASSSQPTFLRVQTKLPRRACMLALPQLDQVKIRHLSELVLSCIVAERFPQWDWLF
jgi:type III secretion protein K